MNSHLAGILPIQDMRIYYHVLSVLLATLKIWSTVQAFCKGILKDLVDMSLAMKPNRFELGATPF